MTSALVYVRVSTPQQADYGESLDVQEDLCRRCAERQGFTVEAVFREPHSGRKNQRPWLDRLFSYLEKHPKKIQAVIIRDIDRFTRGGAGFYQELKGRLKQRDIALIDTAGLIQPTRNTLEDLDIEYDWSLVSPSQTSEAIAAENARDEVTRILTRLISQEIRNVRQGFHVGPPLLGFKNQRIEDQDGRHKTVLERDQEKAPWIELAYRLRAEGLLTDTEICEHVNAAGYRTRIQKRRDPLTRRTIGTAGGNPLTAKGLQRTVARTKYCGVILGKWTQGKPIRARWSGLVDIGTFNRANRGRIVLTEHADRSLSVRYDVKPKPRQLENPLYPFRFVVRCPYCQGSFRGSASTGKLGKRYPGYHCSRKHQYLRIPLATLHESVERFAGRLKFSQRFLPLLGAVTHDVWKLKKRETEEQHRVEEKTRAQLEAEQQHLLSQLTQTESPVVRKLLEQKIEALEKHPTNPPAATDPSRDLLTQYLKRVSLMVEHPSKLLLHTKNQRALQMLWRFVFGEFPTYQDITGGTPEMAVAFELATAARSSKRQLVAALSAKWNTFIEQIGQGCEMPLEIFSCRDAGQPPPC